MRRSRAIAPILFAASLPGCNTAYTARVPATADPREVPADVSHCLASLGFEDLAGDWHWRDRIQEDPELHAVWAVSATRASVVREEDRWRIVFLSSAGSSHEAKLLSRAFSRCIPAHAPAISVEVESDWFIDLR